MEYKTVDKAKTGIAGVTDTTSFSTTLASAIKTSTGLTTTAKVPQIPKIVQKEVCRWGICLCPEARQTLLVKSESLGGGAKCANPAVGTTRACICPPMSSSTIIQPSLLIVLSFFHVLYFSS
jgi:hypothetical protein